MTSATLAPPLPKPLRPDNPLVIPTALRYFLALAVALLAVLIPYAFGRYAMGHVPPIARMRDPFVILHLATIIPAIPLGAYLILVRKTGRLHKTLGKVWIGLLLTTAFAAFFLRYQNHGAFSYNHLFIVLTLFAAPRVYITGRSRNWRAHRGQVVGLFIGACLLAGAMSFLPGRAMWDMAFG